MLGTAVVLVAAAAAETLVPVARAALVVLMASAVLVDRTSWKLVAARRSVFALGYLEPALYTRASLPAWRLAAPGALSSRPVKALARRAPPSEPIPALLLVVPGSLERHLTPPLAEAQAQGAPRDEETPAARVEVARTAVARAE
jgi:hypothetical protein